jgi:predicted GTPase
LRTKLLLLGAAGRDFHNFNVAFRDNPAYQVVAFTAAQIPNIEDRTYPASLAGSLYPSGIPIFPESELADLIKKHEVAQVIFAYSDVSHGNDAQGVVALATGTGFRDGPRDDAEVAQAGHCVLPLRTGSGKSQTACAPTAALKQMGSASSSYATRCRLATLPSKQSAFRSDG